MKLWIDDVRPAPEGYELISSVNMAIAAIKLWEDLPEGIEVIDIDHDAGDFVTDGGDYIKLLDWLEETGRNYPIRIHSMNPVGVANMRQIIQRNGWTEVK
jgi:hypothetical protein